MYLKFSILLSATLILVTLGIAGEIKPGPFSSQDKGVVSGRIKIEGQGPMPGGIVAFFNTRAGYPRKTDSLLRIPDRITTVDREGRFSVELPAGDYNLGVIIRDIAKNEIGPPGPDEKSFPALDEKNRGRVFEVAGNGKAQELGTITVSSHEPERQSIDFFTVRGTLIDVNRQPFANAWILVKLNPDSQKPYFISEKTGASGKFELQLPAGRPCFLIARDELKAGQPQPGKHVGAYTGARPVFDQKKPEPNPVPLTGEAGETITGIKILVIKVTDAELQKGNMQRQPIKKPHESEIPEGK